MTMNALQVLQAVSYELNIPAPTSIVASTDPATLQLTNLLYAVGRELRQEKCWPQLKRQFVYTGTGVVDADGVGTADMPPDFYACILDTFWDKSNKWRMAGPLTDAKWSEVVYGYATFTNRKYYRIFGRINDPQIQIDPGPPLGDVLTFDYISAYWILEMGPPAVWRDTIGGDTNLFAFDDDLLILGVKYKWCQSKGLEWQAYKDDYSKRVNQAQARWQGNKKVMMHPFDNYWMDSWPNVPDGSFTF